MNRFAAAAIVAASAVVPAQAGPSTGSVTRPVAVRTRAADPTPIVFHQEHLRKYGGDYDLWFVRSDGSGLRKLDTLADPFNTVWLSATRIVYGKQGNLWRLDLNGRHRPQQITFEGRPSPPEAEGESEILCAHPVYSRQRGELYYRVLGAGGVWNALDVATLTKRRLPIDWAFVTDACGDWLYGDSISALVVLNGRTLRERKLTENIDDWPAGQGVLSPDGRLLAFWSDWQIRVLDLRTGRTRRVAGPGQWPHWSPDGKRIAFTRHDGKPGTQDQWDEIWVTDLADNQRLLVSGRQYGEHWLRLSLEGWTRRGEIVWRHCYDPPDYRHSRTDIKTIDPQTGYKRIVVKGGDWPVPCETYFAPRTCVDPVASTPGQ